MMLIFKEIVIHPNLCSCVDIPTPKEEVRCKEDADTIKLRHQGNYNIGSAQVSRQSHHLTVGETTMHRKSVLPKNVV